MPAHPSETVARWIEEQRQERNAEALTWLIREAAAALLDCFPPGQGRETLWGLFRAVAGPEEEEGQS
ncbi:MAG: hypothetical protein L0191_18380 [Acidobacteria bacterium]|nr:hypothetical protein [Acidobacteriota bacterium]